MAKIKHLNPKETQFMPRYLTLFTLFACFAFFTDQATKAYIVYGLDMQLGEFREVIPPFLNWKYVLNDGVNFGLFGGAGDMKRWILIGLTSAIALFAFLWGLRHQTPAVAIFVGLLVGGALGNILDRLRVGAVIDFINNSWYDYYNPFAYNLADVWIFLGLFGLIIWGPKDE